MATRVEGAVNSVEDLRLLSSASEADDASPLIPVMYDVAFAVLALLIVAVTVLALVLVFRSQLTASVKILLIAIAILAPVAGGVAVILVAARNSGRRGSTACREGALT